ncbi:MAG: amphi-Trp domain-containing protein [Candidatus Thermoplasmatota archaeon]|nr:amphi-Trp domain-containing protein [Candidatus Thermoplasmatota archaeon]
MDEIETPQGTRRDVREITDGVFEEEMYVDAKSAGAFLVALGEQLQRGNELTLTGDGWRLPFRFREPVELEIEFEGGPDGELEIEIELKPQGPSSSAPGVS